MLGTNFLLDHPPSTYAAASGAAFLLYLLGLAVYRLYLCPIARFPGPKLATLTGWYEFYYDGVLGGQYMHKVKEMHLKYGPVVRINPWEISVSDPSFHRALNIPNPGEKRHRWDTMARGGGGSNANIFTTVDHDLHKRRKKALDPFFSPQSVKKLQDVIAQKVEKMCTRMAQECEGAAAAETKNKTPIRLKAAVTALTTDVITDYVFAKSHNALDNPDFDYDLALFWEQAPRSQYNLRAWPIIFDIMDIMPGWLMRRLNKPFAALQDHILGLQRQIEALKAGENADYIKQKSHATLFHEMLEADLPPEEKTVHRLRAEAFLVVGAGTETTATILTVSTVYVRRNPDIQRRLKQELAEAIPDPSVIPPLQALEKLPYLTAVIRESLRLGYGVCVRNSRIADVDLATNGWTIPAGTPTSMSSAQVHMDASIFPDPLAFNPERWLRSPDENAQLYKHLVSFGKGPRMCLGINLAYAELYMAIAMMHRRFDIQLDDTRLEDLRLRADFLTPTFYKELTEVRVGVTPVGA